MNVIKPSKLHVVACRRTAIRTAAGRRSQCYDKFRYNNSTNSNTNSSSGCISISQRSYHNIIGSIDNDKEHVDTKASRPMMMAHYDHRYQYQSLLSSQSFALCPSPLTPSSSNTTPTAIITRSFSTGHPPTNNANDSGKHKIRKDQIKNAAKRGGVAVKKGATSIKDMIQKYGWTFVGTYVTIYVVTLGSLFTSLDTGLLDPTTLSNVHLPWHSGAEAVEQDAADAEEIVSAIDMVAKYMKKYSWTEPYADLVKSNPHTSNLAIAWVATKLTEPLRIGVTLAIVPRMWKLLGNKDADLDSDGDDDHLSGDVDNRTTTSNTEGDKIQK
mmetsp:Transcript_3823/g.5519  ORF Transcript_3823/g.5519 Transcript_3823/m.5519 type:complete len:327 (-) Transcript_3823:169-1149(-)